jgi:hypothetical protein
MVRAGREDMGYANLFVADHVWALTRSSITIRPWATTPTRVLSMNR